MEKIIPLTGLGRIGDPLGSPGGQGTVYELPDRPGWVLKRYHPGVAVSVTGLLALVGWPQSLVLRDRKVIDACTAWPAQVVDFLDDTYGFVMRRAPGRFFHEVEGVRLPRDLGWAYLADAARFVGLNAAAPAVAAALVYRIAVVFDVLHRNSVVYGDFSSGNALWSCGPRPQIFLFDCDAAHVVGQPRALLEMQTPLWDCPWDGLGGPDRDLYKLALAFLRLYFRYEGPVHTGTGAIRIPDRPAVTREVHDLMAAGLRKDSALRPPAAHWLEALPRLDRGLRSRRYP